MNKFQPVDFQTLDDLLEFLPADEQKIVEVLRKIIFNCIPNCQEKLSYNVPIYSRYGRICFLWPGSVPWGGMKTTGVRLGFIRGYQLTDEVGYLDKGNRKQIYTRDFLTLQDIDPEVLKPYIIEATILDEEIAKTKKASKRKWV
ncbi:hypothetical protein GCM10023189_41020 [Nibrella saemangeumensis]|uniref:YdhG-like domain-containing protein n=1 Tax=Nibrella saemangeumensis TaxID=1084526 RepID=A0ABP8NBT6_9BACT